MVEKILAMLNMQHAMNSKVHTAWVEQHFEWYRAIWIECAELMDHHGWKWWKHQTPDIEQIKLELVDIWHFGMSLLIADTGVNKESARTIAAQFKEPVSFDGLLNGIEEFAQYTLQNKRFSVAMFAGLLKQIGLSFDDLYVIYISKNVLNFFRQDHGYKDGTYIKLWGGREDNEHLVEVVRMLDTNLESFKDDLYRSLQQRYLQHSEEEAATTA